MTTSNTDVELEAILADDSKPITDLGASDQNSNTSAPDNAAEEAKAEASARAQERIRELIEENKTLKQSQNISNSTDIDKFVNSIEDEPSRNLLKTYGDLLQKEIEKKVNPVVQNYQESQFDKEFSMYGDKIPELASHREEIKKTYLSNPSLSIKSLVGDTLLDIQSSRIKPVESSNSIASRETPSIADASTEDLYAILATRPPIK